MIFSLMTGRYRSAVPWFQPSLGERLEIAPTIDSGVFI
jgi:hypothetical protein